jgi:Rrf2 family transcriptional regulator, cysteine metabolism repressor
LKLSKRTEYALRALIHLGRLDSGNYLQARDIARMEDLPAKFLESVMLTLKKIGVAQSKVGSGGGYRLSKRPADLMIGHIIRQLEGTVNDNQAMVDGPMGVQALGLIQSRVSVAHAEVLDTLSLEQILDEVQKSIAHSKQDMYFI